MWIVDKNGGTTETHSAKNLECQYFSFRCNTDKAMAEGAVSGYCSTKAPV